MLRIQSVDSFRVLAIVAVIAIHTVPFGYGKPVGHTLDLVLIINQVARFAVPFFFVIAGYFWSAKITPNSSISALSVAAARRVGIIFVGWSLIYIAIGGARSFVNGGQTALLSDLIYMTDQVVQRPVTSLLEGGKPHLWFLAALLISILVSGILLAKGHLRFLIVLAIGLYGIGLLGGAYRATPLGIDLEFNFRNGPFFALICFVSGHLLRQTEPNHAWMRYGALLSVLALSAQFAKLILLHSLFGMTMWQDYVASTLFLGIGVAMMALSNHSIMCINSSSRVGPFVLGIYATHYFFVDAFRSRHGFSALPWLNDILYVWLVFALSIFGVFALSRFRLTKRLVV